MRNNSDREQLNIFYERLRMNKHTWAIDISLKSTGIAVFNWLGSLVFFDTIKTNPKDDTQYRLQVIGNYLEKLLEEYPPEVIVMENSFSLHAKSTQMLYRVHGVVNYILSDYKQIYYSPAKIKKMIAGSGRADKEEVEKNVREMMPDVNFSNFDESDAVAIGITYFNEIGKGNYAKKHI